MRTYTAPGTGHRLPESDSPAAEGMTSIEPDLTVAEASRMAVTAVTSDLEYWARSASVDGRVGLNDLVRVLEVIRQSSIVS